MTWGRSIGHAIGWWLRAVEVLAMVLIAFYVIAQATALVARIEAGAEPTPFPVSVFEPETDRPGRVSWRTSPLPEMLLKPPYGSI